jgi:hypothetical protein
MLCATTVVVLHCFAMEHLCVQLISLHTHLTHLMLFRTGACIVYDRLYVCLYLTILNYSCTNIHLTSLLMHLIASFNMLNLFYFLK